MTCLHAGPGGRTVPPVGVLVTRPEEAGRRLSAALRDRGQDALWWPAFDLLAPEDAAPLHELGRGLDCFDLVIFVSPAAVRGWARLGLAGRWPADTAIAAVGASTLRLALETLDGVQDAPAIAPAAGESDLAGSEGLWQLLRRLQPPPRQVLIVRAEGGREYLAQRLREAGSNVAYASVYRRVEHRPDPASRAVLQTWAGSGGGAAVLLTSSEAVATLDRQLEGEGPARAWLRQGLALCTHPRIAQALQAGGYARIRQCDASAAGVLAAIQAEPVGASA